jgi:hypothetical protein
MSTILNSLKEKFIDIYELLLKNSGENNLIFFVPNARFYSVESLNDKTFFLFSHIQKIKLQSQFICELFRKSNEIN